MSPSCVLDFAEHRHDGSYLLAVHLQCHPRRERRSLGRKCRSKSTCTKLLLGARVAVPAACLCLSNRVRHLLMTGDAKGGIGVLSFDLAMYIIVQDHRFNLTENIGCSPAVYNSVPALVLVWLPPFILCISAIVLTCITMYRGHRRGFALARTSRSVGSSPHTFDFLRPLLRSLLIASLFLTSSTFTLHAALASTPHLLPWTSWDVVHMQLSHANVVSRSATLTVTDIEVTWWMIPTSSFVLIGIFLVNLARASREDCSLDGYRTMVWRASTLFTGTGKDEMRPLSCSSSVMDLQPQMSSKRSSETLKSIHPMDPERKGSTRSRAHMRVKLAPLSFQPPDGKAASPPTSIDSDDTDISFAQSAMSYLDSPVGRATIASMPRPPSIFRPANIPGYLPDVPPPVAISESVRPTNDGEEIHRPSSRRRPSSIISGPWPRPPSSLPPSPVKGRTASPVSPTTPTATPLIASDEIVVIPVPPPAVHRLRPPSTVSVDMSLASSTVSTSAYALESPDVLHDSPTLPHFPPFANAGVPADGSGRGHNAGSPRQARRTRSKDGLPTLGRNLSLNGLRGREKRPEGLDGGAIYMTVVHETVHCSVS
ncbi:pheromone A receptor-domain-containing protein [Fomitopsis serialis]|uniref:pheromone A receptor-domain-containing protein n=1 Tax=Fomitopsis serialis TaxID=139415 RepID=UPI0020082D79|nr:pheromone A receptor-domain-containing protein [Neoantrodia serialis]KAH9919608.1 pheromone A receptor-domain-containing protein [Neoantrodia serialis]